MRSLLTIFLTGLMALTFTACGGGGNDTPPAPPTVDNSALADGENEYGYYGENVILGETLIAGDWQFDIERKDSIWHFNFSADGQMTAENLFDGMSTDYGVSKDGMEFTAGGVDIVRIVEILGNNCYTVESYDPFDGSLNDSGTICKL